MIGHIDVRFIATRGGLNPEIAPCHLSVKFSRAPPFLLRGLSYMKDGHRKRADRRRERIGGVDGGSGLLIQKSQSDS